MVETADVVVIGGGCLGTACAFFLAKKRAGRVLLLEKDRVCSGITGRSSGIVRQSYVLPDNARLATRGLRIFERFDEVVGGDANFHNSGMLWVGNESTRPTFEELLSSMNEFGAEALWVSAEEVQDLAPGLHLDEGEIAAWEPHAGYTSAPHVVAAYARQARANGAEIRELTRATQLLLAANGAFTVITEHGSIETRTLVNAAGGWSAKLLAPLGVELPLKPYPVQVSQWLIPVDAPANPPIIADWADMAYLRPFPDGTLLLGATDEAYGKQTTDPESFDPLPNAASILRDRDHLLHRYPGFASPVFRGGYAAFYDLTPDNQFILGEVRAVPGLYNILGAGHAFKMAPAFGELTADLIVAGRPSDPAIDLRPYRLERFGEGTPLGRAAEIAAKSHGI